MYLKSLVLKGFKSFADRTVMNLEPGLTCIVGPNGSGKSNISDAVLWVLGERSPKNLRGQSMEDVIFSGSKGRKAVNVAEVTLVLDNSDGALPVEFTEIELTRRMYRSGGSDYLINGSPARLMDFLTILHDSGLGTGTHSIISQGNLDVILQSKPEDRRALIEEAAGVLKHKQRKEQSHRKLELMDTHLARVRDIHGEVARQLGPLERKAKRALTYKELTEEYAGYRLSLAVDDLRVLQRRWDKVEEGRKAAEARCEELKAKREAAEAAADELSRQLEEESRDREAAMSRQARMATVASRLDGLEGMLAQLQAAAAGRRDEEAAVFAGVQRDVDGLAAEVASLAQARETAREELAKATAAAEEARAAQQTQAAALRAAQKAADDLAAERTRDDDTLAALRKRLSIARTDFDSDEHHLAYMNSRIADAKDAVQTAKDACVSAETAAEEAASVRDAAATAECDARTRVEHLEATLAALEGECATLKERLSALDAEARALAEVERAQTAAQGKARAWALGSDSPLGGAVTELKAALTVEDGCERAVERALGQALSALVARSADPTAIRNALTGRGLHGDLNLLIDAAASVADAHALEAEGSCALADKVQCPASLRPAVDALLGDVVLAEDLETALDLRKSCNAPYRFVTRVGDVIAPSGLVTFAGEEDTMGALARQRRAAECSREREAAKREAAAAEDRRRVAESALSGARAEALEAARNLATLEGSAAAAGAQANAARGKVASAEAELDSLVEFCATLASKHDKAKPVIDQLTADIAALEESIAGFAERTREADACLQQARRDAGAANERANAASVAVATAKSALTLAIQRESDRKRDADAAAARRTNALRVMGRKAIAADRLAPTRSLVTALVASLDARLATQNPEAEQDTGLAARTTQAHALARELRAAYDETFAALSDARVEKAQLELNVQSAVDVITKECGVSVEAALRTPGLEDRLAMEAEAARLKKRITGLGTVSPEAAQEYLEVKSRFDFLDGQLADLEQARAALKKIDAVIDGRMREDFITTFATVDANFREIFATLFPGGQAELVLVDPDDPENTGVEVVAQPKGKRITKMMLMSGGEKSLVALALLFAVYKTRTTPFYILDEVEAALDDTNLRRLLAYLEELRSRTQLVMITHQRRTMEAADVLFGVSMSSDGVTKVLSQRLERALAYAEG